VIASVPWSPLWQGLLTGVGFVVGKIYDLVPNYGLTIILLTVAIRVVLLPLGIKQIRSMQHMQAIQPKIKAVQTKFKGNKQRQQEEVMRLYKEHGVNPFSGCWPVLLQFPILIAMYSVLRYPQHPVHIPQSSDLYKAVVIAQVPPVDATHPVPTKPGDASGTSFLGMNLLCSASNAGSPNATLADTHTLDGKKILYPVDCGTKATSRIPYYVFAVLMFATTYYQQRQMQKASPPGASSQQQQAMLKVMPIMFGVFGIFFPAGLVLYWTTSNVWQIGQQYFMLKNRPTAESLAARADGSKKPAKKGFMATMMERAEEERKRRESAGGRATPRKPGPAKPGPRKSGPAGSKPSPPPKKPGPGGSGATGDRKKRPKR
jgi:YidC/Oxa1 family membrane protein insertase